MANIIEITDFNSPQLDIYARMSEGQLLNRHEPEKGIFIAESPKVVERALDAGCEPISMLVERKHIDGEAKPVIDRCREVPVYTAPFEVLTQLTGFKLTRGMLCAMHRPQLPNVSEVCSKARRIAVLENVMNPTNVGAIFRSAAALNMDAVLLTHGCSNPLYRRAIRVSMGTVFQIPWTFLDKEKGVSELKELGFTCTDSKTNFLFATHKSAKAEDIFNYLKTKNIYVRYFKKPRIDNYLRITIGTDDEMEKLYLALEGYLK